MVPWLNRCLFGLLILLSASACTSSETDDGQAPIAAVETAFALLSAGDVDGFIAVTDPVSFDSSIQLEELRGCRRTKATTGEQGGVTSIGEHTGDYKWTVALPLDPSCSQVPAGSCDFDVGRIDGTWLINAVRC